MASSYKTSVLQAQAVDRARIAKRCENWKETHFANAGIASRQLVTPWFVEVSRQELCSW